MIRTLRRKFIAIAMLSLLGTLTVLCGAIAAGNAYITADRADRAIDLLYQNSGEFPSPPEARPDPSGAPEFQVTPETPFETRYFIVELTDRREVQTVDTDHIAALDRQTVVECVNDILADGGSRGYVEYYRFGVFEDQGGGSTVIVLDCFLQLQSAYNMLRVTLLVALACAGIVFLLLAFFSRRAIRPFAENLERQRQFVTDASHELKTPLAILSADLGMLEEALPEDRWLRSAQGQVTPPGQAHPQSGGAGPDGGSGQTRDCDGLLPQRRGGGRRRGVHPPGGGRREGVDPGDHPRRGGGGRAGRPVPPALHPAGQRGEVLATPGGTIVLSLSRRGRSACLLVSNPCEDLDPRQLPRYFDRFYRADSSRARSTGGYGIGLSTAKAIVARHRGRITVRYEGRRHHLPRDAAPGGETMSAVHGRRERENSGGRLLPPLFRPLRETAGPICSEGVTVFGDPAEKSKISVGFSFPF